MHLLILKMKLRELIQIEEEVIAGLRRRAAEGDNEAAQVLLDHLRAQSEAISKWQKAKDSPAGQQKAKQ